MKTLVGKFNQAEEIKRFYFDGKIKLNCPECKSQLIYDFSTSYLMNPVIGIKDGIGINCEKCDEVYYLHLTVKSIDVVIEYDEKNITKDYEKFEKEKDS